MPQSEDRDRKIGHTVSVRAMSVRVVLLRAALGATCLGLVGLSASLARAGDDDGSDQSALSKFMQTIGLRSSAVSTEGIRYTERSPLVVPPSRDLPPPAAGPAPAPDWPTEPSAKHHKAAKSKEAVVPPATPIVNPNPPTEKKTWYNPATWFNKEEYATFTGEPVRENLTDPPTGYRTPSPDQPYGIGPESKKGDKPAAVPSNLTPVVGGGH